VRYVRVGGELDAGLQLKTGASNEGKKFPMKEEEELAWKPGEQGGTLAKRKEKTVEGTCS